MEGNNLPPVGVDIVILPSWFIMLIPLFPAVSLKISIHQRDSVPSYRREAEDSFQEKSEERLS